MPTFGSFLVSFDTSVADVRAPAFLNLSPADGEEGVSVDAHISFDVIDHGDGAVDAASLGVVINGISAMEEGEFRSGFGGSVSPLGNGFHVVVIPDEPLLPLGAYEVTANARDRSGNAAAATWRFATESGPQESPVLRARPGSGRVHLGWDITEGTRVERFELRRSETAFPVQPSDGDLVYVGMDKGIIDKVEPGKTYFYTIFAWQTDEIVIPYDERASDSAFVPATEIAEVRDEEYVPKRGEFGASFLPLLPHGQTPWGEMVGKSLQRKDILVAPPGTVVRAPVSGVAHLQPVGGGMSAVVIISTHGGFQVTLSNFHPMEELGGRVQAGKIIGRVGRSPLDFSIVKLPTGRHGPRTVRPSYFYLTAEARDGRKGD